MREFVHEPMKTRSMRMSAIAGARLEPHVRRARARSAARSSGIGDVRRIGDTAGHGDDHAGVRAPRDLRDESPRHRPRPRGRRSRRRRSAAPASARAPAPSRRPWARPGRPSMYAKVVSSGATMPARAPPSIDMLQTVIRLSMESARIASPAYSMTWPCPPPTPIWPIAARIMSLAVTPGARVPVERDPHRLRLALRQALRRQHVLDLGRADAEGKRTEGPVGRGVAVAADDRHAGLRQAELGTDHVDDALAAGAGRVERDAELLAVAAQRVELRLRQRGRSPARRRSGRCGPSSRRSDRAGAPCVRRGAGRRRPARTSPRGRDADR